MAFKLHNRVHETSTTGGSGALALAGPVAGRKSFASRLAANDTTFGTLFQSSSNKWVTGLLTFTQPSGVDTITVTAIHESSETADAAPNFTAGQPIDVFIDLPAFSALSDAHKATLLSNMGALAFTSSQTLTAAQQLQARTNAGMSSEIGSIEFWPFSDIVVSRLPANGGSYNRVDYPDLVPLLIKSGTVTFTNGSNNIGWTNHGRSIGDPIKLFTTGGLPTNFTAGTHGLPTVGTNYVVVAVPDANTIRVSPTAGGTATTAGSSGTGTHTAVCAPHGSGDGVNTFTVPEFRGEFLRAWDNGRGVDSNRIMGSAQLDAFQGHTFSTPVGLGGGGGSFSFAGGGNLSSTSASGPNSDGVNGTPRTASETRPRNVAVRVTIRYAA